MGHGDYAVIAGDNLVVVKCPDEEFAQHIVDIHNKSL
jgi:hypothetical protein